MIIYKGRRKIRVNAERVGFLRKGIGLMFRSANTKNLLFEFSKEGRRAITSLFVFFPFLGVWIDSKNRVIESHIVKPFLPVFNIKNKFSKLVEIPINKKNKKIVKFFVGKGKV